MLVLPTTCCVLPTSCNARFRPARLAQRGGYAKPIASSIPEKSPGCPGDIGLGAKVWYEPHAIILSSWA
jgi:hypothetical protein